MLSRMSSRTSRWAAGILALVVLLPFYLSLLQTIPNGSDHLAMIDVGETQIVLNVWGTLHATGYPLFVMMGAPLVALMRGLGVSAATAPGLFSLITMLAALALVYMIALRLTGRPWVSAVTTVAFGLTRTVWLHAEITEIYAFTLLLLLVMLWIAFLPRRPETDERRLYTLALLGGLSVAHHRALAMAIPALVYAMWPVLAGSPRALPRRLIICLALGLLGFLPYLWLPLRAQAGALWVYGEPGTLSGFLDQFLGWEASRFIGPPSSAEGLFANIRLVIEVLVSNLTWLGLIAGAAGLIAGVISLQTRRAAVSLLLLAGAAFAFHALAYTDVLAALILMITLPLALGWALLAEAVLRATTLVGAQRAAPNDEPHPSTPSPSGEGKTGNTVGGEASDALPLQSIARRPALWLAVFVVAGLFLLLVAALLRANVDFIQPLVTNRTGLDVIEYAQASPEDSTLLIPWGPRHFAVGFARDVLGTIPASVRLEDHKADVPALLESGVSLLTLADTFYNHPLSWWAEHAGGPVWLNAAGPGLVEVRSVPRQAAELLPEDLPVPLSAAITCRAQWADLTVEWVGPSARAEDWSVFVHGLDASGALVAQGDQSSPVFGWRPLPSWAPGEQVRDVYSIPRVPGLTRVQYGFYRALPDGQFENAQTFDLPVACEDAP